VVTPAEVAKILAVLAAAYPGFEVDETRHGLWYQMLSDLDYPMAMMATRRHIATSKWPPAVSEIREQALIASGGEELTPAEAWGQVMQAIRRHGYYHPEEALDSLSPDVRRVVEQMGWREINTSENMDTLRAHFLRMYQVVSERARREALMPAEIRVLVEAVAPGELVASEEQ
jgi:hypothetical protein